MRIYTLGTGHGDSTFSRYNSSTAYETDDGHLYLVDCGAPAEATLRRKGLKASDIRAVFITHMHVDHVGGLTEMMLQITKYPKERLFPFRIFLPEESAIEPLKCWFAAMHGNPDNELYSYGSVNDGAVYEDENISVTAVRTKHLKTGDIFVSFSYILHFKKEDVTILHTGDLKGDFSDFPAVSAERDFDACVCEATHYSPESSLDALMKAKFKKLIFSHIGDRWHIRVGKGWQVENGEKELLSYCKTLPYPVMIAHDGDEFLI